MKRRVMSIFTSGFGNSDIKLSCSNITEKLLNTSGPRKQAGKKMTSLFSPKWLKSLRVATSQKIRLLYSTCATWA